MSELINTNDNRATIRWKLLTGASALALTAYASTAGLSKAEDSDRPQVWIELGGELDQLQGMSAPFTAPFMTAITPTPAPYQDNVFDQLPPRFAMGMDGKISFQPEDSDWIVSAGIKYGRSHSKRHVHHQTPNEPAELTFYFAYPYYTDVHISNTFQTQPLADTKAMFSERHTVVDFQVGKDVGLGILGSGGTSNINAGVRFAQFKTKSSLDIHARPEINADAIYETLYYGYISFPVLWPNFHQYNLQAHATRSFTGVGPSLSWNGSTVLAGNAHDGEITMDFSVDAAVLFGRQKAKTDHSTQTHHFFYTNSGGANFHGHYISPVPPAHHHSTRSRSVTVPNVGGFVGLSYRYTDAKLSLGYRYDTFLNAMDTGIDTAKKSNVTFNGPYASISVGLGD